MGLRIDSISVNGLGPIPSLQWAFKDINLIYGKNEQGKTFLVEYILRSLFKNAPKTRNLTDSGQVIVSGIGASPHIFNPKTKKKIEDYIFNPSSAPIDLARLCVIKGGDLSMTSDANGTVTKSILKEYLSDQGTLDKILDRVPAVVQESTWENDLIVPKKQLGVIKSWKEARQEVEQIHELLATIDAEYSQGQAKKAVVELEKINTKIAEQQRAKRAYAYKISTQIEETQTELATIPEESITQARLSIRRADDLQTQLHSSKKRVEELEPRVEHYPWLKTAIDECEKRPEGLKKDTKWLFVILSIISTIVTMVAAFFERFVSLGAGLLTLLFIFLAIKQYQTILQSNTDRQEVDKIYSEFEKKFETKVKSIATLKSAFESMQPLFFELETLNNQIKQQDEELSKAEGEKKHNLAALGQKKGDVKDIDALITKAQESRSRISNHLEKLKMQLAATNINPEEYLDEPEITRYDFEELNSLEKKSRSLEESISNENTRLQILKQRVCDLTRDNMSINWESLIENLRTKQEEAIEDCKNIHAQIAGGIFVTGVIADLRKQEDEHIYRAIGSRNMLDPIKAIIPTYTGVELDGEELVVFNDMQRFPLSAMSTGAKEQVLLALRIGLAAHVLGDQKMFLILDDAFQHSDWNRREHLVHEMTALAKTGWQIIYFSMDDHIRKLFEERVKPKVKEHYQAFDLVN